MASAGSAVTAGTSCVAGTPRVFHAREGAPSRCKEGFSAGAANCPPNRLISCDDPSAARQARRHRGDCSYLSFFDEDDEPRTRVRPRRSSTATAGRPDRQTVLVRQLVLLGGFILIVALLIFVVNGCRNSAKENSLKDYNSDVASIVRDSDSQVGKPFFDLLRNPSTGDLSTQIAGYKVQAEQQYEQAKKISTPDDMTAAQRSFLIAMEMFLTSDVVYRQRVIPLIESTLRDADVGAQRLQQSQFLPGIEWLQPATVADALGQQLSADGSGNSGREAAPGLHGTGIDSVEVGDQTLEADSANRIAYGPDTEFSVNFTNQGENDEVDIDVIL